MRGSIVNTSFSTLAMMNFLRFSTTTERSWNVRFRRLSLIAKNRRISRTWTTKQKKNASLYLWNIRLWYCLCAIFRSYFAIIYIAGYVINTIITIPEAPAHFAAKTPTFSSSVAFAVLKFIFKISLYGDFALRLESLQNTPKWPFSTLKILLPFSNIWFLFSNCILHNNNLKWCRVDITQIVFCHFCPFAVHPQNQPY